MSSGPSAHRCWGAHRHRSTERGAVGGLRRGAQGEGGCWGLRRQGQRDATLSLCHSSLQTTSTSGQGHRLRIPGPGLRPEKQLSMWAVWGESGGEIKGLKAPPASGDRTARLLQTSSPGHGRAQTWEGLSRLCSPRPGRRCGVGPVAPNARHRHAGTAGTGTLHLP